MIQGKKDKMHLMADDIVNLDLTTYTNVGVVETIVLPNYAEPNTSIANGFVEVFDNNGVQLKEIPMAEIDDAKSVGKFAIDSKNIVYLVVDKTKVIDLATAKKTYQYYDVIFKIKDTVKIVEGQYKLTVYDKLQDKYIYKTIPCDKEKRDVLIDTLLANVDLNAMGLLNFEIQPVITE